MSDIERLPPPFNLPPYEEPSDIPLLCSAGGIPYNKVHLDAKDAEIARLSADNARLRAIVREAYRAGFWEWAGPVNEAEHAAFVADEQAAWAAWQGSQTSEKPRQS